MIATAVDRSLAGRVVIPTNDLETMRRGIADFDAKLQAWQPNSNNAFDGSPKAGDSTPKPPDLEAIGRKVAETVAPLTGKIPSPVIEAIARAEAKITNEISLTAGTAVRELTNATGVYVQDARNTILELVRSTCGKVLDAIAAVVGKIVEPVVRTIAEAQRVILDALARTLAHLEGHLTSLASGVAASSGSLAKRQDETNRQLTAMQDALKALAEHPTIIGQHVDRALKERSAGVSQAEFREHLREAALESATAAFAQWFRRQIDEVDAFYEQRGRYEALAHAVAVFVSAAEKTEGFTERVVAPLRWSEIDRAFDLLKRLPSSHEWISTMRRGVDTLPPTEQAQALRAQLQQYIVAAQAAVHLISLLTARPDDAGLRLFESLAQHCVWSALDGFELDPRRLLVSQELRSAIEALSSALGLVIDPQELLRVSSTERPVEVVGRVNRTPNVAPGRIVIVHAPPLQRAGAPFVRGKVVTAM